MYVCPIMPSIGAWTRFFVRRCFDWNIYGYSTFKILRSSIYAPELRSTGAHLPRVRHTVHYFRYVHQSAKRHSAVPDQHMQYIVSLHKPFNWYNYSSSRHTVKVLFHQCPDTISVCLYLHRSSKLQQFYHQVHPRAYWAMTLAVGVRWAVAAVHSRPLEAEEDWACQPRRIVLSGGLLLLAAQQET